MPIPSVTERVRDFGLGTVVPANMAPVYLGVAGGGTNNEKNVLKFYNATQTLREERGEGPLVESVCHALTQAGGPIGLIELDPAIAAANGAVIYTGDGPLITVSGSSRLDARARVKITDRGIRGTAKFVYTCDDFEGATDSERTYSDKLTVPAGGTFAVAGLNISLIFAAAAMGAVTQSGAGPVVTLTGTPAGDYQLVIEIDLGGLRGTATFRWSTDGGATWVAEDVLTAATVPLGATGLTAVFAAGTYVLAETYEAETAAYLEGDEYYVDVKCAGWNAADLADAVTALSGSTPWRFVVPVTSKGCGDATAHALLAVALQAHLNTLATASKYRRGMMSAEQGATTAATITAQSSVSAIRCLFAYGYQRIATTKTFPGFAFPVTHAIDSFAAVATSALASTDLKRVASGPLPAVVKIFHDEETTPSGLNDAKISTLRTWEGRDGEFYITEGLYKSPLGSDFDRWPKGILMDIACETAHREMVKIVGQGFRYNADGSVDERDCIRWEKPVEAAIKAQLLGPQNAEGFGGHVQEVRFRISRTHNAQAAGVILYTVGIRPLQYANFIEGDFGFVTELPAAAAA